MSYGRWVHFTANRYRQILEDNGDKPKRLILKGLSHPPAMVRGETPRLEPLSPPETAGSKCSSCGTPMPKGRTNLRCSACFSAAAKLKQKDQHRRGRITNEEALIVDGIIVEKKAWRKCLALDHDHLIFTTKNRRLCASALRFLNDVMDTSPSMTIDA